MASPSGGSATGDSSALKTAAVVLVILFAVVFLYWQGSRYLAPPRERVIGHLPGPNKAEQGGQPNAVLTPESGAGREGTVPTSGKPTGP